MDKKTGKSWYCSKCKCYPDNITTDAMTITRRTWDGEYYQGENMIYSDDGEGERAYCQDCDTELEECI